MEKEKEKEKEIEKTIYELNRTAPDYSWEIKEKEPLFGKYIIKGVKRNDDIIQKIDLTFFELKIYIKLTNKNKYGTLTIDKNVNINIANKMDYGEIVTLIEDKAVSDLLNTIQTV